MKDILSITEDEIECYVKVRQFPGSNKLYHELCQAYDRGEISEKDIVTRMKQAEADYYGDSSIGGGERKCLPGGKV